MLVKVGYLGVVNIKLSLHIGNLIEQIVYGRLIIADFIIIGIYFAFKLVYLILPLTKPDPKTTSRKTA